MPKNPRSERYASLTGASSDVLGLASLDCALHTSHSKPPLLFIRIPTASLHRPRPQSRRRSRTQVPTSQASYLVRAPCGGAHGTEKLIDREAQANGLGIPTVAAPPGEKAIPCTRCAGNSDSDSDRPRTRRLNSRDSLLRRVWVRNRNAYCKWDTDGAGWQGMDGWMDGWMDGKGHCSTVRLPRWPRSLAGWLVAGPPLGYLG
ncbi:hypothetical protein IWX49DRAFT_554887 [Phyllosticta citricarpa]|uniref:Uncharacterized protein n=1 Tax=Phyllosticta citricarpa TaxID=55181 RepID=A0ABR1M443_9PEZI